MRNHKYQDEPSWSKLKTMDQNAAWLIIFTIPIWFPVWFVAENTHKTTIGIRVETAAHRLKKMVFVLKLFFMLSPLFFQNQISGQ